MPRPNEQVQQPNEASSQAFIHEGLKGSAPQYDPTVERGIGHGLTATAKWTPPGAVADAAGLLGGPSLYQNVKEGRYMPAALQVASVGLPAALAGRAAIAAGLGAGASKFTKLGKPDVYGMPGYIGYQTAEDWGPSVLGKENYEGAKKAGKAALEKGTNYIRSKFGYADGGEVEDAIRLAQDKTNPIIFHQTIARRGYHKGGSAPYGAAFIGDDKVILGSPHGESINLSDDLKSRVQEIAKKHGAYYEGNAGDVEPNKSLIPEYKGSWDTAHGSSVKGYPIEYLAPMFSNVEVNKPHETYLSPNQTIIQSLLANQAKAKYFQDRKYDEKTLRDFLKAGSEKDIDLIKMGQLPATKENLQKFFTTGESLMWPENWQEYPHNLGKLAKKFEDRRNQYLLDAPPGVYVAGAGHIPELKRIKNDLNIIGGERSSFRDGGEVEDALRLARSRHKYATDGGVPDEGGQKEFLKESLKDSAPQYVESQDFPARAERAVQSVDKTAGAANNLLAKAFSVPEARSPEGRSAKEIVESAIPQDPNQISKQAMQQWQSGDKVGAVETMAGGMPQTGAIRAYHYSPNAFEKFDTSKIGQGGAGGSSFGHGLYFGSKEDDARMWQRRVNEDRGLPKQSGHVYEANLDLDPNKIIDYNKYLHEQPEFVKDALINKLGYEKSMFANPSEGHFAGYPRGDMAVPKSEGAMKSWRDAGLQGVQYYDPNNSYRGYVSFVDEPISILRRYAKGGKTPAWTRAEGKDPEGGLNSKGRASAKAEGHNLKPPQPEGGPRRDSFCSRMTGMKKKLTSAKTANDPDSRINKSLRAWNCADGGAVDDAMRLAKGGEVWEKPRPKSLGKPKHLSESQKASAKASAKAAGRPYPNWVDNANAAKKANK
jgi:hypothetical protein